LIFLQIRPFEDEIPPPAVSGLDFDELYSNDTDSLEPEEVITKNGQIKKLIK